MKILVTGGAGFIGSNFLEYMLEKYPKYEYVCLDNLSVEDSKSNLTIFDNYKNIKFIKGDITDEKFIDELFNIELFDWVINFAAKYHDIGRQDDLEDPNHGFLSSIMIDKVIENDEFYQDKEKLKVLKAMIHYHSIDDEYLNKILSHYEIESDDKVITILKILKDADGLDRVRLSVNYFFSSLDPRYLRLEQSKSLVKFSHQINEIYLSLEKNITMNVTK